jgi:choline dehydrogenase-like flavoprotein
MIYDASTLPLPLMLKADVCVIGSGAGGSAAAMVAAEAGRSVVVLEAGSFITPAQMTQREDQMLPRLLWEGGGRTTKDKGVRIHQGRSVGGSTMHNINLCGRIPAPILREWTRCRGMAHLPAEAWAALYDEVEALLSVTEVPAAMVNRHNRLLLDGARALGWEAGLLRHNRTGCTASGYCLLGCVHDAKNNAAKVLLPRIVAAGADLLVNCQAIVVKHSGGEVTGVEAAAMDPVTRRPRGRVTVRARTVCVAASATATPALLLRSGVPDPSGTTGHSLRIHPALLAAGEFDAPVRAWEGVPQSVECTAKLDFEAAHPEPESGVGRTVAGADASCAAGSGPGLATAGNWGPPLGTRTWIVPAFAHPVGTATMLPGLGAEHRALLARYHRLAVFTGMLHDFTPGRVRPRGDFGLSIDLWPDAQDRAELVHGMVACAQLLFAAGARRVHVPTFPLMSFRPSDSLAPLESFELRRGAMDVTAVHPMGSVPMGDDPANAAVGSDGRHHHLDGLWIADGSLFPTSIGVPPQISIYAMGLHVGRAVVAAGPR